MTISGHALIHRHQDPSRTLIPLLQQHLPQSIPLLRRIQRNQLQPSPTAVILSTRLKDFQDVASPPRNTDMEMEAEIKFEEPWLAAYVDLFFGPETQVIIYSSLEQGSTIIPNIPTEVVRKGFTADLTCSAEQRKLLEDQLIALLQHIKLHILPEYLDACQYRAQRPDGGDMRPLTSILVGSLHTGLLSTLAKRADRQQHGMEARVKIRWEDPRIAKYIFTRDMILSATSTADGRQQQHQHLSLPDGYDFRAISPVFDFALVRSRTSIFRSDKSLSQMNGLAIYYRQLPVGWAFVSFDGSLVTLHIEPEHRGQGLAVQLAKETMRRAVYSDGGIFTDAVRQEKEGYMHADVLLENAASRRVMEKIGGKICWTDAWVAFDLD